MYRINRLNRNVLITADEVLFHAPIDENVDERGIIQNIIIAEERFISEMICDDFYYDFINKKNKLVTKQNKNDLLDKINTSLVMYDKAPIDESELPIGIIVNAIEFVDNADYVELWNMFLWKLTAECVDVISTIPSWLRHTPQGQMLNKPKIIGSGTESASGEVKEVGYKIDSAILNRINPLKERMHNWVCKRNDKFPLYCKDCGECNCYGNKKNNNNSIPAKKSDYVTGIYDD